MNELAERTVRAASKVKEVVDRTCAACGNSCCHQGTMMGSHDALRLVKGMNLEPGRAANVREGLAEKARELRADLDTLRSVRNLVGQSAVADEASLAEADQILGSWERFCDFLEGPWEPNVESIREMLKFAGIRALALRAFAAFPGGHSALANLAREESSFKFRGRRMAPPRCFFHTMAKGCLAGRWKPGKCANFFCSGDPNVLRELRSGLSFDDFVLGNAMVMSAPDAVELVRLELSLGADFAEPKIFIGLPADHVDQIRAVLAQMYGTIHEPTIAPGHSMQSVAEWDELLENVDAEHPCLIHGEEVTGAALYELAIALDQRRAEGIAMPFVLAADTYRASGPFPHPLWADEQMSQPLGTLGLCVIDA